MRLTTSFSNRPLRPLISRPTNRKNRAINPLWIKCSTVEPGQGGVEELEIALGQRWVGDEEGQYGGHEEHAPRWAAVEDFAQNGRTVNGRRHGSALSARPAFTLTGLVTGDPVPRMT
jgi:hypothetical protein